MADVAVAADKPVTRRGMAFRIMQPDMGLKLTWIRRHALTDIPFGALPPPRNVHFPTVPENDGRSPPQPLPLPFLCASLRLTI